MDLIPLSTIRPDTLHWLWPGWLPQGKLAILDGDPGTGKSLITLDICARLTRGLPFPDADPLAPVLGGEGQGEGEGRSDAPSPSSVIILSAEDAIADTVLPRLTSFGADMSRIFTLGTEGLPALGDVFLRAHLASLEQAMAKCHPRLVIIDPLMAFLDRSIATASDSSVRSVLTPLARLAQDHSCAILMVRHLTKKGRHAIYRGGGSIGILGACRSAWLTGRDPRDPSRFILTQTKNNLASTLPALAYTLDDNVVGRVSAPLAPVLGGEGQGEGASSLPLPPGEGRGEGALTTTRSPVAIRVCRPCPSDPLGVLGAEPQADDALSDPLAPVLGGEGQGEGELKTSHFKRQTPLTWLGPCTIEPNDLLISPSPRPRTRTRQILEDLLADGPLPYPEILRRAPEAKHTTLFRAKDELNIQSIRVRVRERGTTVSYWLLPGQNLPPEIRPEDIICDPDDILGRFPMPEGTLDTDDSLPPIDGTDWHRLRPPLGDGAIGRSQ